LISLTLASQSLARKKILRDAGIEFQAIASNVDEQSEKTRLLTVGATPADIAQALARSKALDVAAHTPGWVIGADQTLEFNGVAYDKVTSRAEARERLAMLSGHVHLLQTATAVARDGEIVWRNLTTCRLTMRQFSDAYLDSYLDRNMPGILSSVGCYQVEGEGVQLFEDMQGGYFDIMGLSVLELFGFLRGEGVLQR
jgi:septum formation protein